MYGTKWSTSRDYKIDAYSAAVNDIIMAIDAGLSSDSMGMGRETEIMCLMFKKLKELDGAIGGQQANDLEKRINQKLKAIGVSK